MTNVQRHFSKKTVSGKLLLSIAASIPIWLSLFFHTRGPAAQEVIDHRERPALAFDQYMVNLGETSPTQQASARFYFTNRGERPVEVKKLRPSCGCLNPRLAKRTYKPGESGQFSLRMQTANEEPGQHEYYVDVLYEDPKPREVRLTFKVELPEHQVVVRPKALIFYQFGNQPTEKGLVVTDHRSQPLEVVDVESSSKLATARIEKTEELPGQPRHTYLKVKVPGRVPVGRHRALVQLKTDDPAYPVLRVPLLIQGPEKAPRTADGDAPASQSKQ